MCALIPDREDTIVNFEKENRRVLHKHADRLSIRQID